jgi:hypothetical protein
MRPPRGRARPTRYVAAVATTLLLLGCAPHYANADTAITLMTRDGEAEQMDTYTYTFAAMPTGKHYIKWFEPKADMSVVHHMLLFGGAHSAGIELATSCFASRVSDCLRGRYRLLPTEPVF